MYKIYRQVLREIYNLHESVRMCITDADDNILYVRTEETPFKKALHPEKIDTFSINVQFLGVVTEKQLQRYLPKEIMENRRKFDLD